MIAVNSQRGWYLRASNSGRRSAPENGIRRLPDGKQLKARRLRRSSASASSRRASAASAFEIVIWIPSCLLAGKPTFTECKEVKIELGVPES
jgi:hypothetical protein